MKINNQHEYDAAKAKLYNMPLHTNELLLARERIEKQLLEYRREHRIFEAGDKVVYPWIDNKIHVYNDHFTIKSPYRHATDAEIEAGKRGAV